MGKDFKSVEKADIYIQSLKELIDKMIELEDMFYRCDIGLSVKGYIESVEKDIENCLLKRYKLANNIRW